MLSTEGQRIEVVYLLVAIAAVLALGCGLRLLRPTIDTREPPLVSPRIPIFGHALGLLRFGVPYYTKATRHLSPSPIYTFDLYATKMYIVNSGKLVSAIQRNHKIISFDPFLTAAANRMAGITGKGLQLLQEKQGGGGGINEAVISAMHPALLGPALDVMNASMISGLCPSIDALSFNSDSPLDLHAWCRHSITMASTRAVWGPQNPYESEHLRSAFWVFESNLSRLLLNLWPKYTAKAAWMAREKLVQAFTEYYNHGGHDEASALTVARWQTQHDAGATTQDIARLETASSIGLLSNTVPSTFWTLFDIYSRPDLLAAIRTELQTNALTIDPDTNQHVVDLALIRDGCPKLLSAFQEVLRVHSNGAPTRVVYKDVVLDDRYLLKAGSVVQMLAPAVNKEEAVWGTRAGGFDPSRFSNNSSKGPGRGKEAETEKPSSSPMGGREGPRATSYLSFGASPNMCPGRHFAAGEILALAAALILRYDIVPVAGRWWVPNLNAWAIAASVTPPIEEYPVKISTRKEYAGEAEWSFNVREGKGRFSLITG